MKHPSTKSIALISVFAALHVTLYVISPPVLWRNWAIYLAPVEALVLGPYAGFVAALLGSTIGRFLLPTNMWMFGIIAEPLSVLAAGFLVRQKWQPVVAIYAIMFLAYFVSPFGPGASLPNFAAYRHYPCFLLGLPRCKIEQKPFRGKRETTSCLFGFGFVHNCGYRRFC